MKKYLMIGFAAIAFASCSNHDIEPMSQEQIKEAEYTTNFVKRYGEPAKGHTWGFGTTTSAPAFAMTRSHFANKNQYADIFENIQPDPENNGDEIAVVSEWFRTHEKPATYAINWSDFFVWQVSSTEAGKSHMDQLWCGPNKENMEHVNNFNSGNCADNSWVGRAMVMQNSGTAQWAYQESLNNVNHTIYDHFVCIPGYVIAPDNPYVRDYYYVGMDYEAAGTDPNQHVDRDYLYNDWIVRVNPGEYKNAKRVICEDLGNTDDFDFNDVVFDANFDGGQTVICVRAAGGTLPLTVAGVEVHNALLVGPKEMVNTGLKSVPVAIYRVNDTYGYNVKDIPIVVTQNAVQYTVKAEAGEVPQKLCVTTDYEWCSERQNIEEKYPAFKSYVASEDVSWY